MRGYREEDEEEEEDEDGEEDDDGDDSDLFIQVKCKKENDKVECEVIIKVCKSPGCWAKRIIETIVGAIKG
ncbi:MAG: hypothetical protein DRO11_06310 [Methanobacteriota archaeon]|nr:MAG: hypothetical protein DRO11_06310 [Euryarchaeota archaeon]